MCLIVTLIGSYMLSFPMKLISRTWLLSRRGSGLGIPAVCSLKHTHTHTHTHSQVLLDSIEPSKTYLLDRPGSTGFYLSFRSGPTCQPQQLVLGSTCQLNQVLLCSIWHSSQVLLGSTCHSDQILLGSTGQSHQVLLGSLWERFWPDKVPHLLLCPGSHHLPGVSFTVTMTEPEEKQKNSEHFYSS